MRCCSHSAIRTIDATTSQRTICSVTTSHTHRARRSLVTVFRRGLCLCSIIMHACMLNCFSFVCMILRRTRWLYHSTKHSLGLYSLYTIFFSRRSVVSSYFGPFLFQQPSVRQRYSSPHIIPRWWRAGRDSFLWSLWILLYSSSQLCFDTPWKVNLTVPASQACGTRHCESNVVSPHVSLLWLVDCAPP